MTALADLVLLLHVLYVAFAVFGGLFVFWRRWIMWLHVPAVIWAAVVEFYGLICPLTPLENWLRIRAGGIPYRDGFIADLIWPVLYPIGLTRTMQVLLAIAVLVLNLAIYGAWIWRRRTSRP